MDLFRQVDELVSPEDEEAHQVKGAKIRKSKKTRARLKTIMVNDEAVLGV